MGIDEWIYFGFCKIMKKAKEKAGHRELTTTFGFTAIFILLLIAVRMQF